MSAQQTSSERQFKSPFVDYVGIEILSMADGESLLKLPLKPELLNSGGMAHGGLLASLADTAAGTAAFSITPVDKMAVTTDFNMTCLKSVFEGTLLAKGNILHQGRRFVRAEVEISCDDKLLAKAGVSFMFIDHPRQLA